VRRLQKQIATREFHDPSAQEFTAFWQSKGEEINRIVERAEELGRLLQEHSSQFVLCHSDIHTANVLIDSKGALYIVDWDQPLFAPKERDLMFVVEDKATLFFSGYGETTVDILALAYYSYEWVVQEFGDYGERVFLRADLGEETKQDAIRGFRQLFEPGDVVEAAYHSNVV
jgi:spectinomycin phosphotransferase